MKHHANKHKVLLHGIPEQMFWFPGSVDARDFKIIVPDNLLAEAEEQWAPADDPIFKLVPPCFQEIMDQCYKDLGCPAVTFKSFWEVYCDLRDKVDAAVPLDVVTRLNQSILNEPGEGEDVLFALEHLKAPELDMSNVVDVGEEDGGNEGDLF